MASYRVNKVVNTRPFVRDSWSFARDDILVRYLNRNNSIQPHYFMELIKRFRGKSDAKG